MELENWQKLRPLKKLYNIVTYIMGSTQRIQSFKRFSGRQIVYKDNGTQWNFWYHMLNWSLTKIKEPLQRYCYEDLGLADDILVPSDWNTLVLICDFLKGFYEATIFTEGHEATID